MESMNINDLINCIEEMANGKKFAFFGLDEEIDYSKVQTINK